MGRRGRRAQRTRSGLVAIALGLAIEGVDSAPFLSAPQKRRIFHDNAARLLGGEAAPSE